VRGGLLTRTGVGLPQNFIVANPQFASSRLTTNTANSTYHAMQIDFTKRFSQGYTLQTNYTWSRALGEEEGAGQEIVDSYRTLRNLRADKRLMSFHRTHVVRANGTYELPFGLHPTLCRAVADRRIDEHLLRLAAQLWRGAQHVQSIQRQHAEPAGRVAEKHGRSQD
jgi:hypothetical protein